MSAHIVFATRFDPGAEVPAGVAARLAAALDGDVTVVYVAVELDSAREVASATGAEEEVVLRQIEREVKEEAWAFIRTHMAGAQARLVIARGDVTDTIASVAERESADFLVAGVEERSGLERLLLGDTARDLLARAPCPVVLVPRRKD